MKQGNNNEVDLLLRSLARGRDASALQGGSRSGDGNRGTSNHLDADELNSYAEGLVPAPARARYTEHLADCDMCRGIVVGLASASGAATRSEIPEQRGGLSFWQKLAAFFSPAVLRFAVPALVLTAVIGVGMLTLQRRADHNYLAKNEPATSTSPAAELNKQTDSQPTYSTTNDALKQKRAESPAPYASPKEEQYLQDDRSKVAQESGTRTGGVAGGVTVSGAATKDAGQVADTVNRAELRPGYAPEPKAGAPAAPTAQTMSEVEKSKPVAKEQPAKLEDRERDRDYYKNSPSDEHGPNRSGAPRSSGTPLSNRRLDGLSAGRGNVDGEEKKDKAGAKGKGLDQANEVETRTVSGRRFARQGSTWVDTAYDPSRTPIKVARGSEQFRALVADEPQLRAIADQLDGVVIVVWKNRAYRIQ
jgi:hypothetical protein